MRSGFMSMLVIVIQVAHKVLVVPPQEQVPRGMWSYGWHTSSDCMRILKPNYLLYKINRPYT